MATVLSRKRPTAKRQQPLRRRRSKLFHPDGPRLLTDNRTGKRIRLIWHEDTEARQALELSRAVYQQRVDRIASLCLIESPNKPAEPYFRLRVDVDSWAAEKISKAWRPGQRRYFVQLEGDRPTVTCGIAYRFHSWDLYGAQPDAGLARAMVGELRTLAEKLHGIANNIEIDQVKNPGEWEPLPTLAELLGESEGGEA
jgi:hypothetical protein